MYFSIIADPGTLFRANSYASNLMSKHAILTGKSYLSHILRPVLSDIIATIDTLHYEVKFFLLPPGLLDVLEYIFT